MRKNILLAFLVALLFCHGISFAQVTIGSNDSPPSGALLQLTNKELGTDGSNATKGLMLPRVQLVEIDKLKPMYSYADVPNTPQMSDIEQHTGLLVFNIKDNEFCPTIPGGLFVWSGNKWESLNPQPPLGTVTGRSGAVYKTRKFGAAGEWMIENLRETEYDTGEVGTLSMERLINPDRDNPIVANYPKKVYYFPLNVAPNDILAHDRTLFDAYPNYGLLYSWAGASNGQQSDYIAPNVAGTTPSNIQGICPAGWKLPNDYDWTQLEKEIFNNPTLYSNSPAGTTPWDPAWDIVFNAYRPTTALPNAQGRSMKSCNPPFDSSLSTNGSSLPTGFSVLLIGYGVADTYPTGSGGYGTAAAFWSSTKINLGSGSVIALTQGERAFGRNFFFVNFQVNRDAAVISGNMSTVRCKR